MARLIRNASETTQARARPRDSRARRRSSCWARSWRSSTRRSSTSPIPTLGARVRRVDLDDPVGDDRLPAGVRERDPAHRLGERALRREARLDRRAARVHGRLGARRGRLVDRLADRLPRRPGPRRRADHAGRPDDPRAGGRAAADGPRDERDRRPDAARRRSSAP